MKVTEGQLHFFEYLAQMYRGDTHLAAELVKDFVSSMSKSQRVAPDVLKNAVNITPDINPNTGKFVSQKA